MYKDRMLYGDLEECPLYGNGCYRDIELDEVDCCHNEYSCCPIYIRFEEEEMKWTKKEL